MSKLIHYSSPAGSYLLPSGYTRLSYIQSTGIAAIDTGMTFSATTMREFEVMWVESSSSWMYGANSGGPLEVLIGGSRDYLGGGYAVATPWQQNVRYNIGISTITGNMYCRVNLKTPQRTSTGSANGKKEYLFGVISASGSSVADSYKKWRLYTYKIWDNGILVRNYVPVLKTDGTIGVLNLVDNSFSTCAGLIAGPECPQGFPTSEYCLVEWLRIPNGTYYNSGLKINSGDVVKTDAVMWYETGGSGRDLTGWSTNGSNYWGVTDSGTWEKATGSNSDITKRLSVTHQKTADHTNGAMDYHIGALAGYYMSRHKYIERFTISIGGVIKRDMIPCYRRSDMMPGFYDIAGRNFYTATGNGVISIGPSITFGWGEVMNGAYTEPIQTNINLSNYINADKSNLSLECVTGDVVGGNQMFKGFTNYTPEAGATVTPIQDGVVVSTVAGKRNGVGFTDIPKIGAKYILTYQYKSNINAANGMAIRFGAYKYEGKAVDYKGGAGILTATSIGILAIFPNVNTDGTEISIKHLSILDLQTLFPTEQSWVNGLGQNDAHKVLNKLGFQVYEETNGQITPLNDELLKLGAEVIAKMGYLQPLLQVTNIGCINLIDHITGQIKLKLDLRNSLKTAWDLLLVLLRNKNIPIPEMLNTPKLFTIQNGNGIFLRPDGIECSAWAVDLGSLELALQGSGETSYFYAKLKGRKSYGSGIILNYTCHPSKSSQNPATMQDKMFIFNSYSTDDGVNIKDLSYTDAASFKAAMQGVMLYYELATPIFIPFNSNLTLTEVDKNDIITLDDYEGNPMYNVDVTTNNGIRKTSIYPNPSWVEQNKQLPITAESIVNMIKLTNALPHNISSVGTLNDSAFVRETDGYIKMPDLTADQVKTISLKVKLNNTSNQLFYIGATSKTCVGIFLNKLYSGCSSGTHAYFDVAGKLQIGKWHTITIVYDTTRRAYLDGEALTSIGTDYFTYTDTGTYLLHGSDYQPASNAAIKDIQIFDSILSVSEATTLI